MLDVENFTNGYRNGFSRTVRFLYTRGAKEHSEEYAQEAWARAWEHRSQLKQTQALAIWVNSIALNVLRTAKRRKVEQLTTDQAHVLALDGRAVDAERLLRLCPPRDRATLMRFYILGENSREIADVFGCSEVTVRIRLMRAKQRLAQRLALPAGE